MLLGMGSDIFESYCGSMIACIALAASMTSATINSLGGSQYLVAIYAFSFGFFGIICSLLGILTVKVFSSKSAETALRYGTIGSAVFCSPVLFFS